MGGESGDGPEVRLRDVTEADLPLFYEHQAVAEAIEMAAFPFRDWDAFNTHWRKILADETVTAQTVLADGEVAGNVVSFEQAGEREVGYWLGREFWGRGVATAALAVFLGVETRRPLTAHIAAHNIASQRVLEKCGFLVIGKAQASGESEDSPGRAGGEAELPPVDELILRLE